MLHRQPSGPPRIVGVVVLLVLLAVVVLAVVFGPAILAAVGRLIFP